MRLRTLHLASVVVLFAVSTLIGCSRQDEGERCSLTNANSDCEDDLVCTEADSLRSGEDGVDRCCPESGEASSDARCEIRTTQGGDGDSSGDGGAGGSASEDPTSSLGDNCQYDSDCTTPLVCGPGGLCQHECNRDRDCEDGEACSEERRCVSE